MFKVYDEIKDKEGVKYLVIDVDTIGGALVMRLVDTNGDKILTEKFEDFSLAGNS